VPVTSSRSSLKRWPRAEHVLSVAREWARRLADTDPSVIAVGYVGSYARGDAGVGSDLDLLIVRRDGSPLPDVLGADVVALPVPADILHYTESELAGVVERGLRMATVIRHEARWWIGGTSRVTPSPEPRRPGS
jgi:uncharacterized protein